MPAQVELLFDILSGPQPSPVASGLANPSLWAGMELVPPLLGRSLPLGGGLVTGFGRSGQGVCPPWAMAANLALALNRPKLIGLD